MTTLTGLDWIVVGAYFLVLLAIVGVELRRQRTAADYFLAGRNVGFFAIGFPSGVSLYWVVNSIVGIAFNIAVYGIPRFNIQPIVKTKERPPSKPPDDTTGASPDGGSKRPSRVQPARELRTANGIGRSKRQNRRRRP